MFLPVIASKALHKIVWNDFEQALLGPYDCMDAGGRATQEHVAEGEGQDARSNLMLYRTFLEIAAVTLFSR